LDFYSCQNTLQESRWSLLVKKRMMTLVISRGLHSTWRCVRISRGGSRWRLRTPKGTLNSLHDIRTEKFLFLMCCMAVRSDEVSLRGNLRTSGSSLLAQGVVVVVVVVLLEFCHKMWLKMYSSIRTRSVLVVQMWEVIL